MNSKTCTICNIEQHINNFYKKYSECRECNRTRELKRYYENKDKISNQQKIYYEKNREKILLQKQNNRSIQFRDLVTSYVELENKLKALEEKKECQSIITHINVCIHYIYSNNCMYTQI